MKKKVLFVCIENSNRSQMAEAFAKMAGDKAVVYSAGSKPSGKINAKAVAAMKEIGYDLPASLKIIRPGKTICSFRCSGYNGLR